ncbi:hypothetical protein [Falsiroseomonas oryzae]|uniref:hypothetical protein n=1 Tax=Falsiroseomonas oryzae TaxID=2766473 RepID=UPI0022EB5EB0|nr:hypothetical protein [Roseomonas sp. MO-31]
MPFTFDRAVDAMLQVPAVQRSVVASLMTLGFVPPSRDSSCGEVWRVMRQWDWARCATPRANMIFVKRIARSTDTRNPLGRLLIGIELNGRPYRIACDGMAAAEQQRLARLVRQDGVPLGPVELDGTVLFRACAIQPSLWAACDPARGGERHRPAWTDGATEDGVRPSSSSSSGSRRASPGRPGC